MVAVSRLLCLGLCLLAAACDGPHSPRPAADVAGRAVRTPLILVSLDGFRADYLGRGRTPVLARLAATGVVADAMRPAFPSVTEPNHYTLVTGLYPDHHGIVYNVMEDPQLGFFNHTNHASIADERWWDAATPVWVDAERVGIRTAAMFWPGSDVAIHGTRPSLWRAFDRAVPPDDRVAGVLTWLDLPEEARPGLILLYFEQTDEAGHAGGPVSAQEDKALAVVDHALGVLLDGLRRRGLGDAVDLVVVSDHGMAATAPERTIILDDMVDPADVHLLTAGAVVELNPKTGREQAVAARLLTPREHVSCWRKEDIPPRLHYGTNPRIPAFVCAAESGWLVTTRKSLDEAREKGGAFIAGAHGYDPADPAMGGLFVANGPDFRAGARVPAFDNVDLYALLCRLLGVTPRPNDGNGERLLGIVEAK